MPTYWFSLIVAGKSEFTDDEANALYEAGCDDGLVASSCGIAYVHFAREADSFLGAIKSAITDVRKAGLEVSRIEIEVGDLEDV